MTNRNQDNLPLYRVSFSRITGQDNQGQDVLARPKEIGAIWPRKNGKTGGVLQLDIIPIELTQRQGVIFIVPVDEASRPAPQNAPRYDYGRAANGGGA